MNYLAAVTGLQAVPGPAVERRNGHYGNVLLTSAQVLAVNKLDLSYPGREPRGAIDADLDIDGETVRVVVTHLGLLPAERRFQVRKLIAALSEQRTRTVILLSDFNEWLPTGRSLRWIHTHLGKTALVRTSIKVSTVCAGPYLGFPTRLACRTRCIRSPRPLGSDTSSLKATIKTFGEPTPDEKSHDERQFRDTIASLARRFWRKIPYRIETKIDKSIAKSARLLDLA